MLKPAAAAKSLQSCLTLGDPIDSSPPGSPVLGILQAGTLEWVAISFSNAWNWKVKVKSCPTVSDPMDCSHGIPSMGFSRQEYRSGVPLPSSMLKPSMRDFKHELTSMGSTVLELVLSHVQLFVSPPGSSVHGDSLGKNTRVSWHALLQGIFATHGLNSGLLHCRWILYHLSHQEY